ncbi:MAG: hypothetical protein AVDCRST_MAG18-1942 [uncultured Thermomicrobiales bacterium]|uniref:Uncharacterized protein n=1 Tax=uncultured Thermomicrobiales bacterium TaxID=1645740 RepID=A0A6J4V7V3_9BACT|nr:MAG: hypothetical protein AVDCRST_MAG18-1942 [uncultured Thermomicrobiales bacterium]
MFGDQHLRGKGFVFGRGAVAHGGVAALAVVPVLAELEGRHLEGFSSIDKGMVISVGGRRTVAEIAWRTVGGSAARLLKEAIGWEYRQSVQRLRGWSQLTAAASRFEGR